MEPLETESLEHTRGVDAEDAGFWPTSPRRHRPHPAVDLTRRLLAAAALGAGLTLLAATALYPRNSFDSEEYPRAVVVALVGAAVTAALKLWVRADRINSADGFWPYAGAGWLAIPTVLGLGWFARTFVIEHEVPALAATTRAPGMAGAVLAALGILLIAPLPCPGLSGRQRWSWWAAILGVLALIIPASAVVAHRTLPAGPSLPATAQTVPDDNWPTVTEGPDGTWEVATAYTSLETIVGTPAGALLLEEGHQGDGALTLIGPDGQPVWQRILPSEVSDCDGQDDRPCSLSVDSTGQRAVVSYAIEEEDRYDTSSEDPYGRGIAVLDVATGDLIWSRTLDQERLLAIELTGDHLVLQTSAPAQLQGSTLTVYSLQDNRVLWSRPESRFLRAASSTQLALLNAPAPGTTDQLPAYSTVDMVDAVTGETVGGYDGIEAPGPRWALRENAPEGWLIRCTTGCAQEQPAEDRRFEMVELGTGRVLDIGSDHARVEASTEGWYVALTETTAEGPQQSWRYLLQGEAEPRPQPPAGRVTEKEQ